MEVDLFPREYLVVPVGFESLVSFGFPGVFDFLAASDEDVLASLAEVRLGKEEVVSSNP